MFSSPRVNLIESDEGFSVEVLGRTGLRYVEGQKSMFIYSEFLVASSSRVLVLYASSIRSWDPPHSAEIVDDTVKNRIIENIRAAFRFHGHEIDVLRPGFHWGPSQG